jgi:hypothetical protein
MRQISKVLARRVIAIAIVASFAVPFAGAATREAREPGFEGPRPRLVRIVKKIVKSLGDLLSQPRP